MERKMLMGIKRRAEALDARLGQGDARLHQPGLGA
jgi:hypothetical protein